MEKIVGHVVSKTTGIVYQVRWNVDEHTSWVYKKGLWQMVCTNVLTSEGALECTQRFIDSQPDLF